MICEDWVMTPLALGALAFLILHRIISAGRIRPWLVAALGEKAFSFLFSIASALCLTWLWIAFGEARNGVWGESQYSVPNILILLQMPLQLIAIVLIVAGLTTRNPTTSGMSESISDRDVVRGFVRITRHPFLWGISLFSVGHMAVNPTPASWGFFGTLAFLAVTGTFSIDAKRQRALGDDWKWFASATSNLPFLAIARGRQRLCVAELGLWRVSIAMACFALLAWFHPQLFGPSVLAD